MSASFERFRLAAGLEAIAEMVETDRDAGSGLRERRPGVVARLGGQSIGRGAAAAGRRLNLASSSRRDPGPSINAICP